MIQKYHQLWLFRNGSPPHFMFDFSRKMFVMLHSINSSIFIIWLPLLLKILGNMSIAIVCFPGCDVINFKVNHISLIKLLKFTWPKSQDKNLNILRTKKAFKMKWKAFAIIFHGLFSCKKLFKISIVVLKKRKEYCCSYAEKPLK